MDDKIEITKMLETIAAGERKAVDALFPMLYDELQKVAALRLGLEHKEQSLQATELVNEAYLKLVAQRTTKYQNRAHFLALSAIIMRRILIERSRFKYRKKRGAGGISIELNFDVADATLNIDQFLDLEDALKKLEQLDPQQARIVELRFLGGLTMEEIAEVLHVSVRIIENDWYMARAWLKRELSQICL